MLRKCSNAKCSKKVQNIWEFRPGRGEIKLKKQQFFKEAFDSNDEESLDRLRCKLCWHCRETVRNSRNSLTNAEGICKHFIQEQYRNAKCEICNSADNIEFDHIDPSIKTQRLSKYDWWSWNGGVEAMKDELKKCRPLCRACHDQQASSNIRYYPNMSSMPNNSRKEKAAIYYVKQRNEKQQYNNEKKIERGQCKDCGLHVTTLNCKSFHWAHLDARCKRTTISNIIRDSKSLNTAKTILDNEITKCELKCAACHKKETDQRRDLILY